MTLQNETELMRSSPLFRDVPAARCKLVAMSSERLMFQRGEVIIEQNSPSDAVFFVLSGSVRVVKSSEDRVVEVGQLGVGAILGETGVITGTPRSVTMVAREESSMLRIDGRIFMELLAQVPEVSCALVRELSDRLEKADTRMLALAKSV